MDMNVTQLQNLTQKSWESFKEHTQIWRQLAAHFQSPMLNKELLDILMGTLQDPYLERMIKSMTYNFFDLVISGQCIESNLKSGKTQDASSFQISKSESRGNFQ